jgi:hypothetical protein
LLEVHCSEDVYDRGKPNAVNDDFFAGDMKQKFRHKVPPLPSHSETRLFMLYVDRRRRKRLATTEVEWNTVWEIANVGFQQLNPRIPTVGGIPKEPGSTGIHPTFTQFAERYTAIIVSELSSAALADVVIHRRFGHLAVEANWTHKVH